MNPDLVAVLTRGLAVHHGDRYPSVSEFASDLKRWQRREPLLWTHPSTARRGLLAIRRLPPWALVTGVLVAGLLVVLAWSRLDSLARQRDGALARAAASDAARAASDAQLAVAQSAKEQLRQVGAFGNLLRQLLNTPMTQKGSEWVAFFTAIRDLNAPIGEDQKLADDLVTRRIDLLQASPRLSGPEATQGAEPAGDSLESAVISAAKGSWRLESGEYELACTELAEAARVLGAMLPEKEPFRVAVERRLDVATLLQSAGGDAAAKQRLNAAPAFVQTLPKAVRAKVAALLAE